MPVWRQGAPAELFRLPGGREQHAEHFAVLAEGLPLTCSDWLSAELAVPEMQKLLRADVLFQG